MLPHTDTALY